MDESVNLIRQTVKLSASVVHEIQALALAKSGSAFGAMQETLSRGAELALAELRGSAVSSAEQKPPPAAPDMLAGLSKQQADALADIAQMFREGSAVAGVILSGVQAWKAVKNEGDVRAVGDRPTARRKLAG